MSGKKEINYVDVIEFLGSQTYQWSPFVRKTPSKHPPELKALFLTIQYLNSILEKKRDARAEEIKELRERLKRLEGGSDER